MDHLFPIPDGASIKKDSTVPNGHSAAAVAS